MKETIKRNGALILAAGRGTRAGTGLPKVYREIDGISVLRRSVLQFQSHPAIDFIRVVIHQDDQVLFEKACGDLGLDAPCFGGETRAQSVVNGLENMAVDNILIHDGARPFVSHDVISRVLFALDHAEGAVPALKAVDALWQMEGDRLVSPIPRSEIIRAQTPQGFHYQRYFSVAKGDPKALDDAELAVKSGMNVIWVEGDMRNQKLTYKEDFL